MSKLKNLVLRVPVGGGVDVGGLTVKLVGVGNGGVVLGFPSDSDIRSGFYKCGERIDLLSGLELVVHLKSVGAKQARLIVAAPEEVIIHRLKELA